MNSRDLQKLLLATSSVTALLYGAGPAFAACTFTNQNGGVNNTGTINCITFNSGANFTGNVNNASTGTITAGAGFGTATGVSVLGGSTITGSINNQGSITANNGEGIEIVNSTVTGSISNSGFVISNIAGGGNTDLLLFGSILGGPIINDGGLTASGQYGIGLNGATISASITNNGTISSSGSAGIEVFNSTVSGSVINAATGKITSSGSGNSAIQLTGAANTSGFRPVAVVSGSIVNQGTIASAGTGISLLGAATVGGGITNSGTISAATVGILLTPLYLGIPSGTPSVAAGITNTGTISAGGIGIQSQTTPALSIFNSGTVTGGGGTAIQFSGAGNTLTLGPGSAINGKVIGGGADAFQLGGTGNGTFAVGTIGAGQQYQGFGTFTKAGTSAWTLTGSGNQNWTVSQGNLIGDATSLQGNIADNATLTFNQTGAGTYSGALTGNGTLAVQGPGSLTLGVSQTAFAGNTLVSGGTLIVGTAAAPNITLAGPVAVTTGGLLQGHGTLTGSLTNTSGTVLPGGSIGTLTVKGNYAQAAGGTLSVQLTPAAASLLAVSGSASLAGTLAVATTPGTYALFSRYPILTAAGGVSGTFGTLVNSLPAIPLLAQYSATEVDLVVGGFTGQTRNQIAVANTLNQSFNSATGDYATVLGLAASQSQTQILQSLSSFGGQIYTNLAEVSLQDRRLFLGAMDERMRLLGGGGSPGGAVLGGLVPSWGNSANAAQLAALGGALGDSETQTAQAGGAGGPAAWAPAPANNVWARGFGQFGSIDSNGGALGASYSTGGGAIGAELIRTPQSLLGIAASGGQSSVSTKSLPENGTISFAQFGLYGAQAYDYGLAADAALVYAHDIYDVSRGIVLAGTSRAATSGHSGNDVVVDAGVSRPLQVEAWQVTPRVGLSYFHIGQESFAESGSAASLDLAVGPRALDALRSRLGVTASQPMTLGDCQILPELRAAWTHDFLDDRGAIAATFAGAPTASFNQIGAATGRDAADLGAGVSFAIAQTAIPGNLSAFLEYDATLAAHQTANAVAGGLKLTW